MCHTMLMYKSQVHFWILVTINQSLKLEKTKTFTVSKGTKHLGLSLTKMHSWWQPHKLYTKYVWIIVCWFHFNKYIKNANKIPQLQGPGAWGCEWRKWSVPPTQVRWFCTESERNIPISALWYFLYLSIYCVWKLRMTLNSKTHIYYTRTIMY